MQRGVRRGCSSSDRPYDEFAYDAVCPEKRPIEVSALESDDYMTHPLAPYSRLEAIPRKVQGISNSTGDQYIAGSTRSQPGGHHPLNETHHLQMRHVTTRGWLTLYLAPSPHFSDLYLNEYKANCGVCG